MRKNPTINYSLAILFICLSLVVTEGCRNSETAEVAFSRQLSSPGADVTSADPTDPDCCKKETQPKSASPDQSPKLELVSGKVSIPDVTLCNQDGQPVNVARDLAQGKLLVMNFIFTTCKGVCPPMGVNFGQLQARLGDRVGRDVNLVSVSVDPVTDTPDRLKTWAKQFGASAGWTLLTGPKQDVDRFLKSVGVFAANKTEHSPFILVGRVSNGSWQRIHGLTTIDKLSEVILGVLDAPDTAESGSISSANRVLGKSGSAASGAAQSYFTDVPLVDQHGKTQRLYSDIIKGKVVVITPFFTTCRGSCPHLIDTFAKLQSHYEDRLGKDLYLVSLTVDPETDTPEKLKAYADQYHARAGWHFLTGDKESLETALVKLGQHVKAKEDHSNIFIIGNDSTGLWKKAMGLAPPAEIIKIVDSVLNDKPS
jgi:protein SCO1